MSEDLLNTPIEDLPPLTTRAHKALYAKGIKTLGDLVACSDADLLRIPNFGKQSWREVREMQYSVLGNPGRADWPRSDITWLLRNRIEDWTEGWITMPIRHVRMAIDEIERLRALNSEYPERRY